MAGLTGALLFELLLAAFGVAINPPAVIASIVFAASSRPKSIAFAGGWTFGLLVVGSVVVFLGDVTLLLSEPSKLTLTVKIVVGVGLIALGASQWLKHRRPSAETKTPTWMRSLEDASPPRAFLVAAAYASFNPKTMAFIVAGALTIIDIPIGVAAEWTVLVLFVLLSSLTVAAPVAYAALAPQRSRESLSSARRWLGNNGAVLTAAVLGVLGAALLYSAATGLAQLR